MDTLETALTLSNHWNQSLTLEENIQQTPPMLLLLWNCRDAKSPNFHAHLTELINYHKPTIIILTETKVSGLEADTIMGQFNYEHFDRVDSEGASGGLYAL